jgi:hypothetical protein
MKAFKYFFEQNQQNKEVVAIFPGGFKPPTKGHFEALNEFLKQADRGVIFIGKSPRDGITQEQAYQIWSIYAPYISKPVEVYKSEITPVKSTYDYAQNNPNINIIVGAGPEDGERYNSFRNNPDKYPNVRIVDIKESGGGVRGTTTRERIMSKDPSVIDFFVPETIKQTDKERIKKILDIA